MATTDEKKSNEALAYHAQGRPGKIEVVPTTACTTASDLALAYTPGVAAPCREIAKTPDDVFKYTAKGNLVAVITNGTAVLGLGNIGPMAGKPVMEGKGILFKRFADIDVFDIEVDETSVDGMVQTVKAIAPTFGGINLEDIRSPECFEIEKRLIEELDIPVFHDDQHGTAIIAAAGLLNAVELTGKKMADLKVVFSGAGAAAMACAELFFDLGVDPQNLLMCDSRGVIYKGRGEGMNEYKERFANDTKARTLADALKGADCFMGLSGPGVMDGEMVKSMAKKPIIFAMANPDPEIYPHEVHAVRDDAIMATGRSDFPNQVNNVLGFPFIFRGALDVRAKRVNKEMKLAAVRALADLAKEEVPENVRIAYDQEDFSFGPDYIIPKPFDMRVLTRVAPAVAKAAIDSGVARTPIEDFAAYRQSLAARLSKGDNFMKGIRDRLDAYLRRSGKPVRMIFSEGNNSRILEAAAHMREVGRIEPILLGEPKEIRAAIESAGLGGLEGVEIIQPEAHESYETYFNAYLKERQRKGVTYAHARELMTQEQYFGAMHLRHGHADAFISGPTFNYNECLKPIIQIIGTKEKKSVAGIFILVFKNRVLFLADCTTQVSPTAEDLCAIAESATDAFTRAMRRPPRVAFLSFSNFGGSSLPQAKMVRNAVRLFKESRPNIQAEGEMQADVAVNHAIQKNLFPFSELDGPADVLVFPDLNSANVSYKLLAQLAQDCRPVGPLLFPLNHNANIIQRTADVSEIVNVCYVNALLSFEDYQR